MVFDEIDTGMGARLGAEVGRVLHDLCDSGTPQLLCATHLPQVGKSCAHVCATACCVRSDLLEGKALSDYMCSSAGFAGCCAPLQSLSCCVERSCRSVCSMCN